MCTFLGSSPFTLILRNQAETQRRVCVATQKEDWNRTSQPSTHIIETKVHFTHLLGLDWVLMIPVF